MSDHIVKSHNKTLLLYHLVFPAKYRRKVFTDKVDEGVKTICLGISERYEIHFVEIGVEDNHVHFLVQSIPTQSPTQIIKMLKSITAREIFRQHPEVKKQLWGGEFWSDGYYVSTVGKHGNEDTISRYVREQGVEKEYKVLHKAQQLALF